MKPSRYIAALVLAALLFSCEKGAEGERAETGGSSAETPISFDSDIVSTPVVRGVPISPLTASSMGVYAYFTETTAWVDAAATATPNWMVNEAVRRPNSAAPWASNKQTYWPFYDPVARRSNLSFFAYAPYATADNGIRPPSATTPGIPRIGFELLEDISSQTDLLLSAPRIDMNKTSADGMIQFALAHKLSKIGFRAYCLTPGSTILSISLTNLPAKGEIEMDADARWTLTPGETKTFVLDLNGMPLSSNPEKPTHLSDPNNYFLLFPADYRTGTQPELLVVFKEKNKEQIKRAVISEHWEQGKSTLYTLNLGGNATEDMMIESVTVSPWTVNGREDLETN